MKLGVWLATMAALCTSCGGDVHFVTAQPVTREPSPRPPSDTTVDKFLYQTPAGIRVSAFVFYPEKSLQPALTSLGQNLDRFLDALRSPRQEFRFSIAVDNTYQPPSWLKTSTPDPALVPLRNQLNSLELKGSPKTTPFETFQSIALRAGTDIPKSEWPVWLTFYYFRNSDAVADTEDYAPLSEGSRSLTGTLSAPPLSPYRTSIYTVAYLNTGGACDPLPGWVATDLLAAFAGFNLDRQELCEHINPLPWAQAAAAQRLATQARERDSRMILSRRPDIDTLVVTVLGKPVPRHLVAYLDASNEIGFRAGVPANVGDEVQVSYQERQAQ